MGAAHFLPRASRGRALVVAAVIALTLSAAPAASAATRYASPNGSPISPCTQADPCDLATAITGAGSGDEVIVAPGDYGPFSTELRAAVSIALHGAAGQPRPRISSSAATALSLAGGAATTLRDLELIHTGSGAALDVSGGLVERVAVSGSGSRACAGSRGTIIRDSVCRATGAGAAVSMASAAGGPIPRETATVRNVTAVSVAGAGLEVRADNFAQLTLRATNVIAQGGSVDARAVIAGTIGTRSAELRLDHSNYDTTEEIAGGVVTPAGSATNQVAPPQFRNLALGDLHQAPGSPTIDAGITDPANGETDIDRQARVQGAGTDIGADEFQVPDTTITAAPLGLISSSTATFSFTSSDANARFECRVDTGPFLPCSSPYTTAALEAGAHTFEVRAVDAAGTVDPTPASRTFTVRAPARPDTTPPETVITAGAVGTTTDTTLTFEFSSNERDSRFECSLDGATRPGAARVRGPRHRSGRQCRPEPRRELQRGRRAPSLYGRRRGTPATEAREDLQCGTRRRWQGVGEPPEGSGECERHGAGAEGPQLRSAARAQPQLPVGTLFDTRRGTVRLTTARNARGALQSGDFSSGVFQALQSHARRRRGLTELRLKGASFRSCAARRQGRRSSAGEASRSRRSVRRLRGRARGRFRTSGRYSAATVRGTEWTTADRCDGTLTAVARGRVAVRDFRRRTTILIRAGKSYLARAP